MSEAEGVIKYRLTHHPSPLPEGAEITGLLDWFERCRARDLIGQDPARYDGYAYGNISVRAPRGFVISGTQTGGTRRLREDQLAWVESFDQDTNELIAGGPVRPSSEAMTHGQVYRALPDVGAVIHVHSPWLWEAATVLGLPATPKSAPYGTQAMAKAVDRLLRAPGGAQGIFAMGGHQDGVVAYGRDMDDAGQLLLATLARAENA